MMALEGANYRQRFPLTDSFNVKEGLGIRSHFNITNPAGELIGTSLSPLFTMRETFELKNSHDEIIAKGQVKILSLRKTINFTDSQNEMIGSVTKKICGFFREYTILNPQEEMVAKVKGNFWDTSFTITDPQTNEEMARFTRPFFRWLGESWKVEIKPANTVDGRILSILPMFITSEMNSENFETSESSNED